ncbi:hypothetical protein PV326_003285, partial [Microctonus aethiopoides]
MCRFKECINLIINFSGIKYLNLKYVEEIDDNFLIRLVENCTELEYLNVSCCADVSNDGINTVSKLKKLTTLMMQGLRRVTDIGLSKLGFLKVVRCKNCLLLEKHGIITSLQNAPYLEKIDLQGEFIDKKPTSTKDRIPVKKLYVSNLPKK